MSSSSKSSPSLPSQNATSSITTGLRGIQVAFVIGALAAVIAFANAVQDGEVRRSPESILRMLSPNYMGENRTAPNFALTDRNGRRVNLSDYRGKVVVLHFWTRTCGPCIQEIQQSLPAFDDLVANRSDIALLLVTIDRDWNDVSNVVPPQLRAPILFDPDRSTVTGRYGTRQFPETWIIDREGVIRARFDRAMDWSSGALIDYLQQIYAS